MRHLAIILLVCGLGLATACKQSRSAGTELDGQLRRLIPPATRTLAGLSLDRLRTTDLYRQYADRIDRELFDRIGGETGVDLRREVTQVIVALTHQPTPLLILRGHFDASRVAQHLIARGATRGKRGGYPVWRSGPGEVSLLNEDVLIGGPSAEVESALDRSPGNGAGMSEELAARLKTVPADRQAWLVDRQGVPVLADVPKSEVRSALSNLVGYVRGASLAVHVDQGFHFAGDLDCVSDQGAQRVRDAIRGAIGLGRLSVKDNQLELLGLYDALDVKQSATSVNLRADLSADLVEKSLRLLPSFRASLGGIAPHTNR